VQVIPENRTQLLRHLTVFQRHPDLVASPSSDVPAASTGLLGDAQSRAAKSFQRAGSATPSSEVTFPIRPAQCFTTFLLAKDGVGGTSYYFDKKRRGCRYVLPPRWRAYWRSRRFDLDDYRFTS